MGVCHAACAGGAAIHGWTEERQSFDIKFPKATGAEVPDDEPSELIV